MIILIFILYKNLNPCIVVNFENLSICQKGVLQYQKPK